MNEQRELEEILIKLGYTKKLLEKRMKIYDNAAKCIARVSNSDWSENIDVIVAGSRGEGMSNSLNSDLDVIMIQPAVQCYHMSSTANDDKNQYVFTFELDEQDVPHGYVKLRLIKKQYVKESDDFYRLSCIINGSLTNQNYLKNNRAFVAVIENDKEQFLKDGWLSSNYQHQKTIGPAQPLHYALPFKDIFLSIDYVQAFNCVYPTFFDEWCERVKMKKWPCASIIEEIRKTKMFVVPVGFAGRADEDIQWRLSFTLAERQLVRSFSDAQVKAYAALKMLVKQELKPICENINSYLVKNIIFWISEERIDLLDSNFYVLFLDAMKKFKECIDSGYLPSYIIPSRNLLQDKLLDNERKDIISVINQMCLEGVKVFHRCPLIKSMYTLSGENLERVLLFRNLSNEVVMALFAIPPEDYVRIQQFLYLAKTRVAFIYQYFEHVLPLIRQRNPNECFPLLTSMNEADIERILHEGFEKCHNKVWCN